MKVYLSGPFDNRGKVRILAESLKRRKHEITFDWYDVPAVEKNIEEYNFAAKSVYDAIKNSEVLVIIITDPKQTHRSIFTEIGIALGMGKKILIFNEDHNEHVLWLSSDRIETTMYYHMNPEVKTFKVWSYLLNELENLSTV